MQKDSIITRFISERNYILGDISILIDSPNQLQSDLTAYTAHCFEHLEFVVYTSIHNVGDFFELALSQYVSPTYSQYQIHGPSKVTYKKPISTHIN